LRTPISSRLSKFLRCHTLAMSCLLIHRSHMLRFKTEVGEERLQVPKVIAVLTTMSRQSVDLISRGIESRSLKGRLRLRLLKKSNPEVNCITNHTSRLLLKNRIIDRIRRSISQTKLPRVLLSTSLKTHPSMP
jgi:hypothetical protein